MRGAVVMLPRDVLAARAAQRLEQMLTGGAIEEVAALLSRPIPKDRPVLRALGVREIAAFLAGTMDRDAARDAILKQTIAYQKRQRTWARGRQAGWTVTPPDAPLSLGDLASIVQAPR